MSSRCCYLVASNFAGRLFLEIPEFPKFSARVAWTRKNSLTGWWRLLEVEISKEPWKRGSHELAKAQTNLDFILRPLLGASDPPFLVSHYFRNPFQQETNTSNDFSDFFLKNLRDKNKKILKYEETPFCPSNFISTRRRRLCKGLKYTLR